VDEVLSFRGKKERRVWAGGVSAGGITGLQGGRKRRGVGLRRSWQEVAVPCHNWHEWHVQGANDTRQCWICMELSKEHLSSLECFKIRNEI
jgi:hypothetical protein